LLKGGVEKQHAKRFVIRFCLAREPLSWPSDKFVLPTQVFCDAAAAQGEITIVFGSNAPIKLSFNDIY